MQEMPGILTVSLFGVPLVLGLLGLAVQGRTATAWYRILTCWGLAYSIIVVAALAGRLWEVGPINWVLWGAEGGRPSLGVYVDALSLIMLALTAGIGFLTCRYSIRYLDGAAGQARFLGWTQITIASVLCLLCSRNLIVFVVCWCSASIGLHQLLTFFADRPAAIRAAWKKFVISRLGDACLLAGVVAVWREYGTLEFLELFRLAADGTRGPGGATVAVLLALGAMTKSAQFPFHTWLPETMEAPTPVSALMHAGIINAGGYLIVRLSPLVAQSPLAMDMLMVNGALTAMLGSVVMLTQTDVKRSLAYSTISQMGFMMMQCGLGAFSAAVLHIVAHGLFKAHAFLGAGAAASYAVKRPSISLHRALLYGCAALAASAMIVAAGLYVARVDIWTKPGGVVIATFLGAGIAVIVFRAMSDASASAAIRMLIAASTLPMAAGYLGAWKLIDAALKPFLELSRHAWPSSGVDHGFSLAAAALVVTGLFASWAGRPLANSALGRRAYVLALNGFYIGDLLRRPFDSWKAGAWRHRQRPGGR